MPTNATRDPNLSVLAVGVDPGALEGCTVETADDMLGALAHLAGGGIDVVVAFLNLPDASGTDVIVSLRERAPEVPVIVVGDGEAEPSDAFAAGASDVLPPDATTDLVSRAIRYAATLRKVEAGLRRNQAFDELTGLLNARGFDLLANHHSSGRSFQGPRDHPVPPGGRRRRSPRRPRGRRCRDGDQLGRARDRRRRPCRVRWFRVLLAGASTGTEPIVLERIVEAVAAQNAKAGRDAGPSISVGAASYDPSIRSRSRA